MSDRYGDLDDRRIYANLLTQWLFSNEAARGLFEQFERIRNEQGRPGHIIVQLPRANSLLTTAEWELLRHPIHPEQALVSLSCPLLRKCDIQDKEPELQALPNLAQLKLAVTSSNLDDQIWEFFG